MSSTMNNCFGGNLMSRIRLVVFVFEIFRSSLEAKDTNSRYLRSTDHDFRKGVTCAISIMYTVYGLPPRAMMDDCSPSSNSFMFSGGTNSPEPSRFGITVLLFTILAVARQSPELGRTWSNVSITGTILSMCLCTVQTIRKTRTTK